MPSRNSPQLAEARRVVGFEAPPPLPLALPLPPPLLARLGGSVGGGSTTDGDNNKDSSVVKSPVGSRTPPPSPIERFAKNPAGIGAVDTLRSVALHTPSSRRASSELCTLSGWLLVLRCDGIPGSERGCRCGRCVAGGGCGCCCGCGPLERLCVLIRVVRLLPLPLLSLVMLGARTEARIRGGSRVGSVTPSPIDRFTSKGA